MSNAMKKTGVMLGACLIVFAALGTTPPSAAQAAGLSTPDTQIAAAKKKKKRHPGRKLYMRNTCVACHGRNGKGAILAYPNLAGQNKKYMIDQIKDIMKGKRTGSPDETGNPRSEGMRGALVTAEGVDRINKEQIAQIVDWLSKMEPAPPPKPETPVDPARIAKGKKLYKKFKCRTCHGKDGTKPLKGYPYISGQKTEYLITQMKDIRDKKRINGKSKTMYVTIKKAKDEQIALMADYLSSIDRMAKK